MKNIFSVTAAAAVLFSLAACTTPTAENTASPARSTVQAVQIPEQELRTIATAYAQDVIGGLEKGDYVVITGSVPELLVGGTNFIKIHKIGLLGE